MEGFIIRKGLVFWDPIMARPLTTRTQHPARRTPGPEPAPSAGRRSSDAASRADDSKESRPELISVGSLRTTYIHMCVCIYIDTYIYIYVYIYAYIRFCNMFCGFRNWNHATNKVSGFLGRAMGFPRRPSCQSL